MNDIELLAISKLAKKGAAVRSNITPGQYNVDFNVSIKGTINVGEDYESTPTVRVPTKAALALFVKRMGFQRDEAIQILTSVMTEAVVMDKKASDLLLQDGLYDEAMNKVKEALSTLPKQVNKGKVTHKLELK